MSTNPIRRVSLDIKVVGQGYPLLLLHGGHGLDHTRQPPLRGCADQLTLVFYDQRSNGLSIGPGRKYNLEQPGCRRRGAARAVRLRALVRSEPFFWR